MNAQKILLTYALAWIPLLVIAIANGALRQIWYQQFMTEQAANQLSCLSGSSLFLLYTILLGKFFRLYSAAHALFAGLLWLAMTIAFEFTFGRLFLLAPWEKLLHEYNIFDGRLWSLVLLVVFVSPYLSFRFYSR